MGSKIGYYSISIELIFDEKAITFVWIMQRAAMMSEG